MRLHILTIGKPKLGFARAGVEEYLGRLRASGGVELTELKSGKREQESAALLERSEGLFRVVLDERGEQVTSRDLAARITAWELSRVKGVAFLIGGADGHTDELRQRADWRWSLSRLTLQHELALIVLLEQLYRARAINAGIPYHRD
jgi:23S rRNA (pseudouridine1915-N3)-methyltransferase